MVSKKLERKLSGLGLQYGLARAGRSDFCSRPPGPASRHRTPLEPMPHNSCEGWGGGWTEQSTGQHLEILYDGGAVELVAGAGAAAQSKALEGVVGLQMCEANLD